MKRTISFLLLNYVLFTAHADLVMQNQSVFGDLTNTIITRIHGDKIRDDVNGRGGQESSIFQDVSTGDQVILMHRQKTLIKNSGARAKELIESISKRSGNTNATNAAPKLEDTGKSEKVGIYNTEIYSWSDADGMTLTYCVAKDFPEFDKFKTDLAKFDRANFAGTGKDTAPELSKLPGMVVKSQMVWRSLTHIRTLISAKEEPVDPSVFQIPEGYREINPTKDVQPTNSHFAPAK